MRHVAIRGVLVFGVSLFFPQIASAQVAACKPSVIDGASILAQGRAVPEQFAADLAAGNVKLDIGSFETGKPVEFGDAKTLHIDWKALDGKWDAIAADVVKGVLRGNPRAVLLWSGKTQCHQDVRRSSIGLAPSELPATLPPFILNRKP